MRMSQRERQTARAVVGRSVLGLIVLGLVGCASEPPKPAPTVTPEQVRGHADQTFEKLKQEEQRRPTDQPVSR